MNETLQLDRKTALPFAVTGGVWFLLGVVVCAFFATPEHSFLEALGWMGLLWSICLFDLYALARAVGATLGLTTFEGEKRGALIIQASYWGVIKLACLGILGTILLRRSAIPTSGLLMGSATLIVVPLIGGYGWSQKVFSNAS